MPRPLYQPQLTEDGPNPESVLIMREIDSMAPEWRALVREYGLQAVRAQLDGDGCDIDMAEMNLWMLRERKQREYSVPMFSNVIQQRLQKYRSVPSGG